MAQRDYGLAKFKFKRVDGKGDVLECPETPSAYLRATRKQLSSQQEENFLIAYYSAEANGLLGKTGISFDDCTNDDERMLRFFDHYQVREVLTDDNGKEVDRNKIEPNPTLKS